MRAVEGLVLLLILTGSAPAALAQSRPLTREPRGFVSVGAGVQGGSSLTDTFTFERYAEAGTVRAEYPRNTGLLIDVSTGVRIWKRLGLGAAVTRAGRSADGAVQADVPHPFFVDRHRPVAGAATELSRDETGVHVQLYWEPRLTGRLGLRIFGGPSIIHLSQDVVTGVEVVETYPYDEAAFGSATHARRSATGVGAHGGVDTTWMLTRRVGAGVLLRYAWAGVDLNVPPSRTVRPDAGGLQAAAGLRIRF